MAARGRGRGRCLTPNLAPGGRSPPSISDPIGEAALNSIVAVQLPDRPNVGSSGKAISLLTNHFEMKLPSNPTTLFHYDIAIEQGSVARNKIVWTSGKAKGWARNEIRDLCYQIYMKWAEDCRLNFFELVYDRQKNLYSLRDLGELGHQTVKIVRYKDQTFEVTVTLCNPATVVLSPETLSGSIVDVVNNSADRSPLQILDLITNQFLFYLRALNRTDFIHFGRHFYRERFVNNRPHEMKMGRLIYEGFFKSLRIVMGPTVGRGVSAAPLCLTLNIDTKKAPFFKKQPLIDTVMETLNLRGDPHYALSNEEIRQLNRHLSDLRVKTTYKMPTTFVLCPFTSTPCGQQKFQLENRSVSVADYHKSKYNADIRYPMLPCVRKRGKPGEYVYYPIEVCEVVAHQKVELKKTNEDQSRELIKVSAVPPEQRLLDIKKFARFTDESPENDQNFFAETFGIQRSRDLMKVQGRLLSAPKILFGEARNIEVINGQWNAQNQILYLPAKIGQYAVVAFANERNISKEGVNKFIVSLSQCARKMGVQMVEKFSGDYAKDENAEALLRYFASQGFNFVVCIMGDHLKTDKLRNMVKLCEVKYTIVTQCVRARTVLKCINGPGQDTYKNLVYKINAKNGGVNNELVLNDPATKKWLRPGVMFVGMDVNHPPPMSKAEIAQGFLPKEPSVVGAVANSGRSMSDYRMQYFLQDARKEEISECHMVEMFRKFVQDYASNHEGARPDTIFVYRDGVSEGQFKMVVDREILAMKQAFACLTPPFQPKLVVLTVQKRHNTRFFQEKFSNMRPEELRQKKNVEKNVPAGTVVDTGPVSTKLYDFFLCSHVGLQGTSKASYYVVMLNECNLLADELQSLTFALCHDYQRCTKSVSLPAPCYHAHHAAARGKSNYLAYTSGADDSSSGFSSGSSDGSLGSMKKELNYDSVQKQIEYGPLMVDKMIWL